MPDQNDYTEAGETFRKSMQEALDHLDSIADEVRLAQEKAIEDQIAAQNELQRIEREAEQISKDYVDKHRKEIESGIRDQVLFEITKNMIRDGMLAKEIYTWLQIPQKMLADAWMELGFEPLNGHVANVGYEDQGRSGYLLFQRSICAVTTNYGSRRGQNIMQRSVVLKSMERYRPYSPKSHPWI